jgi:hypothetical protein
MANPASSTITNAIRTGTRMRPAGRFGESGPFSIQGVANTLLVLLTVTAKA